MAESVEGIEPGVPDRVWYGVSHGLNVSVRSSDIDQIDDIRLRMGLELQLDSQLEGRNEFIIPMTDETGAVRRIVSVRRLPLQLMDPE